MADYTLSDYHERSKRCLNRYAPGPGRLDWANQPNPFRRYEGAVDDARLTTLPAYPFALPQGRKQD